MALLMSDYIPADLIVLRFVLDGNSMLVTWILHKIEPKFIMIGSLTADEDTIKGISANDVSVI